MDIMSWSAMAEWYDAKEGDNGDLWHWALIDPPPIRLVGSVSGQRVLDSGLRQRLPLSAIRPHGRPGHWGRRVGADH